ncbi:unannotated protein [freshwater metagenome]|uniref:Unannotated protein n=1 Tax=freshwater metagenome TaxID=449393 RepID=A0A6J7GDU4_9ZZZZ
MFGFRRRPTVPPAPVVPWQGAAVRAEFALLPVERRRDVPSVVLAAGGVRVQLHASDVRAVGRGRAGIAESAVPPLAFLCRPGAAGPGSAMHDDLGHLPSDSWALVLDDAPLVAAAVLDGAEAASFLAWAADLPG